jgi:hypothetical protein
MMNTNTTATQRANEMPKLLHLSIMPELEVDDGGMKGRKGMKGMKGVNALSTTCTTSMLRHRAIRVKSKNSCNP